MNKARADCLTAAIAAAIDGASVHLADIATHLPGKATPASKFHRLQDFFREVDFDYGAIARLLLGILRPHLDGPLYLALDRTNWENRQHDVNLLVLSVCMGDVGIPLLWTDLRHPGNSDTAKRIRLLSRFRRDCPGQALACLVGDREFIGQRWFAWLKGQGIPFVMRLRENFHVTVNGKTRAVEHCFHDLAPGTFRDMGACTVLKVATHVCGVRTRRGELLLLAYQDVSAEEASRAYMRRWNIETGFEKLKSHGFNMESTRLHGGGKMERLLAVLSLSLAWCYACGRWRVREQAPIRLKRHGRPEESVFARGRRFLASIFHGIACELQRVTLAAFAVFRCALPPPT